MNGETSWYIHTRKIYAAITRNGLLIYITATSWRDFKEIMLTAKYKEHSWNSKIIENGLVFAWAIGKWAQLKRGNMRGLWWWSGLVCWLWWWLHKAIYAIKLHRISHTHIYAQTSVCKPGQIYGLYQCPFVSFNAVLRRYAWCFYCENGEKLLETSPSISLGKFLWI